MLGLYQAIEEAKLGGVGSEVSPAAALAAVLKVDQDALPPRLVQQIKGRPSEFERSRSDLGATEVERGCGSNRVLQVRRRSSIRWFSMRLLPPNRGQRLCARDRPRAGWLGKPTVWPLTEKPKGLAWIPGIDFTAIWSQ